jgi:cytoskeletal protein CcmA (bactofilin family)
VQDFTNVSDSHFNRVKQMALFNKEMDQNAKNAVGPNFGANPQPDPVSATPPADAVKSDPREKITTPVRPSPDKTRSNAEGRTYLDRGCKISGKLWFEGDTRIDGQVDGEINAKENLVIGESAVVTAQIKANSIVVAGKASGDIIASQRLEIRPSARVTGNVASPVMIVHEGAMLEGKCSMQPQGMREDRNLAELPKEVPPQIASKQA